LSVNRVVATMYIQGVIDTLPRKAPAEANMMHRVISFYAPNLSVRTHAGTELRTCQREGMATMRPTCW